MAVEKEEWRVEKLIIEEENEEYEVQTKVIKDAATLKPLLSKDALAIFSSLGQSPKYPAMLAKELVLNEQKVYYYIKQLKNAGLIEIDRTEERNGASAKFYSAKYESFSFVMQENSKTQKKMLKKLPQKPSAATEFLQEFLKNGIFSAKIVVGSPDPHGKGKARARDGHLSAELAAFIGANCAGFVTPLVFLDTMVSDLKNENSNIVIIGGPLTNKLCEQVNEFLPIKFAASSGNWTIKSDISGKEYSEDAIGVVQKIPHPFFKGKNILLFAGRRNSGTIAAILALSKKTHEMVKPNTKDPKAFARVVEGLDIDGDGMIDDIEFRE